MGHIMKGRTVNMAIKKALHDIIPVPTLMYLYASETWTWNEGQRSRIQAVKMSYLRGACGLNRMEGERNGSVDGKFDTVISLVSDYTLSDFGIIREFSAPDACSQYTG